MSTLPNVDASVATRILRSIQTINPRIGYYVASTNNPTMGLSVKVENGLFQISMEQVENYRRSPRSLSNADYESIANTFETDRS